MSATSAEPGFNVAGSHPSALSFLYAQMLWEAGLALGRAESFDIEAFSGTSAGMRGMIALSVEVKGPARDLHSGNEGGVLPSLLSLISSRFTTSCCKTQFNPALGKTQSSTNGLQAHLIRTMCDAV